MLMKPRRRFVSPEARRAFMAWRRMLRAHDRSFATGPSYVRAQTASEIAQIDRWRRESRQPYVDQLARIYAIAVETVWIIPAPSRP